jgi:hypothetical protein
MIQLSSTESTTPFTSGVANELSRTEICENFAKILPHLESSNVPKVSRCVVLPKRWIVERTIAWLNRC